MDGPHRCVPGSDSRLANATSSFASRFGAGEGPPAMITIIDFFWFIVNLGIVAALGFVGYHHSGVPGAIAGAVSGLLFLIVFWVVVVARLLRLLEAWFQKRRGGPRGPM